MFESFDIYDHPILIDGSFIKSDNYIVNEEKNG